MGAEARGRQDGKQRIDGAIGQMRFGKARYDLSSLNHREYERVFILMNGPGAGRVNWDVINDELRTNRAAVLVTNAMLSVGTLYDSENVIFLNNDPVLDLILASESLSLENKQLADLIVREHQVDVNDLPAMEPYFKSCEALIKSKHIKIASAGTPQQSRAIDKSRRIFWHVPLWARVFNRTFYAWHGDGSASPSVIKRWGFKSWPIESRLWPIVSRSRTLSYIWYILNFHQTCNTWYRALDLAVNMNTTEICFVGRNSQIQEWLNADNKVNDSIHIKYNTFMSDHTLVYKINSFEGIMREMLYSSQYIRMLKGAFPEQKFISLDETVCYLDFYSRSHEMKYLL